MASVVSVLKGLAETQFFAHSVGSGYMRDVSGVKGKVWKVASISKCGEMSKCSCQCCDVSESKTESTTVGLESVDTF